MLVVVIKQRGAIDRRSFLIANELNEHRVGLPAISEAEFHSVLAEQALLVQLDPEAALEGPAQAAAHRGRPRASRRDRGADHDAGARAVRPRLAPGEEGQDAFSTSIRTGT